MSKISLLIDTSFQRLSLGLLNNDKIIDFYNEICFKKQSEEAIPEIKKLLKKNKMDFKDLKAVIVGIGPGSFTGVRIGVTIAKVLCYSLKIDLYGISSMISQMGSAKNGICVLDARAGRSYICAIKNSKIILKECVMSNEDTKQFIKKNALPLFGEAKHLGIETVNEGNIFEGMINLKNLKKNPDKIEELDAIYLKGTNDYKKM